jgi:hypothetical protein
MRQRWSDAELKGEAKPEEWRLAEIPFQIKYIWHWFLELHTSRHFGPHGPLPITYQDMVSWSMLTERKLGLFEIKVVRQLDQRYFYVLRTPNGAVGEYLDDKQVERDVAATLRALAGRRKPEGQGLAALPVPKKKSPITVPVINFGKKK